MIKNKKFRKKLLRAVGETAYSQTLVALFVFGLTN